MIYCLSPESLTLETEPGMGASCLTALKLFVLRFESVCWLGACILAVSNPSTVTGDLRGVSRLTII